MSSRGRRTSQLLAKDSGREQPSKATGAKTSASGDGKDLPGAGPAPSSQVGGAVSSRLRIPKQQSGSESHFQQTGMGGNSRYGRSCRSTVSALRAANMKNISLSSPVPHRVQAQRKFAQGAGGCTLSSPAPIPASAATQAASGRTANPGPESSSEEALPSLVSEARAGGERPKTEDFLTFLCLRGTALSPAELDFFNVPTIDNVNALGDSSGDEVPTEHGANSSDEMDNKGFDQKKVEGRQLMMEERKKKKRKMAPTVEAIKRKYIERRLARKVAASNSNLPKTRESKCLAARGYSRTRSMNKSKLHGSAQLLSRKASAATLLAKRKTRLAAASRMSRMLTRLTPRGTSNAAFVKSTKKITFAGRSLRGRDINISSDESDGLEGEEGEEGLATSREQRNMLRRRKVGEEEKEDWEDDYSAKRARKQLDPEEKSLLAMKKSKCVKNKIYLKKPLEDGEADEDREKRKSDKRKAKQSLKELQDQLLAEAKLKISAVSPGRSSKQEGALQRRDNYTGVTQFACKNESRSFNAAQKSTNVKNSGESSKVDKSAQKMSTSKANDWEAGTTARSFHLETTPLHIPAYPVHYSQPLLINTSLEVATPDVPALSKQHLLPTNADRKSDLVLEPPIGKNLPVCSTNTNGPQTSMSNEKRAADDKTINSPGPPLLSPQIANRAYTNPPAERKLVKPTSNLRLGKKGALVNQPLKKDCPVIEKSRSNVKEESSPYDFVSETVDIKPKLPFSRKVCKSHSDGTKTKETSSKGPAKKPKAVPSEMMNCSLECTGDTTDGSFALPKELATQLAAQAKKKGASGNGMTYFIPLQSSSGQSLGVAVKLGTEGPSGPNQKVVMKAKLVTKSSIEEKKEDEPKPNKFVRMPMTSPLSKEDSDSSAPTSPAISDKPMKNKSRLPNMPVDPEPSDTSDCCFGSVESMDRFPKLGQHAHLVEAPTFSPNEKEFKDPLKYIESIRREAEPFGICKIIPPSSFKPECNVDDDMRFTSYSQYVHKFMSRWGSNSREMAAIKKYLETQNVVIKSHPVVGGVEIDLPALYHAVQNFGGLTEVIQKKRWGKIADYLRIPKGTQDRGNKLDDFYCKYILPWDTLSEVEREDLLRVVDEEFEEAHSRKLERCSAAEPAEEDAGSSDEEDADEDMECVVKGKSTSLSQFYRVARNLITMIFKKENPDVRQVEEEFWRLILERDCHVQAQQGSIDTGDEGFGFPTNRTSSCGRHPWNLKVLSNNRRSVLRCMGPVMGVTVPTLHVGMVFTTGCWYRDPHGLPWIEYLHSGAPKIWYSVPESHSLAFYTAMKHLVPAFCKKRKIWLPADTTTVPPNLLVKHGVSVTRTIQEPGQFLIVFPKTYTSYTCTGYSISESVFFAPSDYLNFSQTEFQNIRESNEPMMFPLPKLVISIASDSHSSLESLQRVKPHLERIRDDEYIKRTMISDMGVKQTERIVLKSKKQDQDDEYECEICSENLYVSYVCDLKEDTYFCLDHAVKYLHGRKPSQRKHCKLLFTHSKEEISNLIKILNKKLQSTAEPLSSEDEEVVISKRNVDVRAAGSSRMMQEDQQKKPSSNATKGIKKSEKKSFAEEASTSQKQSTSKKDRTNAKPEIEKAENPGRRASRDRKATSNKSGNLVVDLLEMMLSASETENEEDSDDSEVTWS